MKISMLKAIMLIVLTLSLTACGDNNPTIGKWKGKLIDIEFTNDVMILSGVSTPIEKYTIEEEKVTAFFKDKHGNETGMVITVVSNDKICAQMPWETCFERID